MRLILIHAPEDGATADVFAEVLNEKRYFEVERVSSGEVAPETYPFIPVVVLWSARAAPFDRRLEAIAFEAWEENMLLLIALDASERPVGLRDLSAIEAMDANARQVLRTAANALEWSIVTGMRQGFPDYVRERVGEVFATAPTRAPSPAAPSADRDVAAQSPGGGDARVEYLGVWGYVATAAVIALIATSWLNFSGAVLLLAAVALVAAILVFITMRKRRATVGDLADGLKATLPPQTLEPRASDLFVSYAHADRPAVDQVLDAVKATGQAFWIDRAALHSGANWAGEIVRAIKSARGVLVMCSTSAFGSDHVKREVYLADKYKKAIVPIFVEPAEPPDDFEYFLAGLQRLDWYSASVDERWAALAAAVARL